MKLPDVIGRLRRLTMRQKAIAAGVAVVVVGGAAGAGIALASSDSTATPTPSPVAIAQPTASPTPAPTPRPKPKPKPVPAVNPLTGVGAPIRGSVVAVKINDTSVGAAQVGIDQADVVYIEQVEGGLTRLIAVYDTHKPVVGPVRSVRASDVEVLSQYGRITLGASGGGGDSLPTLDASILKSTISDRGGPGFFRDESREAPYNLMLNLVQASTVGGAAAKSIGWTWSARPVGTAPHGGTVLQTVVGGTPVEFRWNGALKRYVRFIGGSTQTAANGALVATPNVVVQYCRGYTNFQDVDVTGNPGHYTKSVGSGRVAIFRNGVRIDGTWSRPSAASGTTYRDARRRPIPLAPGGAWVVLTENGQPLTSR